MKYHYPPIHGFAKRQPKVLPEQLFSDRVLDAPRTGGRLRPRKQRNKPPPTTLCGLTSKQATRVDRVDCEACQKMMEQYPQLGNLLQRSTLADTLEEC